MSAQRKLWQSVIGAWVGLTLATAGSAAAEDDEAPDEGAPEVAPSAPAAPAPAAPATAEPEDDASRVITESQRAKARERFEKGVELFGQEAWTAALAEFLESRALFPTRSATKNAAVCFRRLERFDEALDMFETLMREYEDLSSEDKELAQREIAQLRTLVGTVDVGASEPGAMVIVDGRTRGDYPLIAPLRVPAGSHTIRVFKEGFEPFETRVDLAGGQRISIDAPLAELKASGRLRVVEQSGKAVDVVVDGAIVGKTPWDGLLGVGSHVVLLRGEGNLGTEPVEAAVRSGKVTALTLVADELESAVKITASPGGASVTIDAVQVGRGAWDGLLRPGPHWIEVAEDGFVSERVQVRLDRGEQRDVEISLERDLSSDRWKIPSRVTVEADAGFAMLPSFGGDVAGACEGECARTLGVGGYVVARGGYEWGTGLGLGLSLGYLAGQQNVRDRSTQVVSQGLGARGGVASDDLSIRGLLVGLSGSYHFGEQFPITLRLGAGGYFATVRDVRSSTFQTSTGAFEAPEIGDDPSAAYIFVDPEARVGWVVAERFEVSLGLQALVLLAVSAPKLAEDIPVVLPDTGYSKYGEEKLTGGAMVAVVPGLGARYAF